MTNEEAKRRIEICRDFLANNYSDMGEPNFMAFDMAIKALEQEPCEDCISREETILHISERLYETAMNNQGYEITMDKACEDIAVNRLKTWINELPSVTPKTELWNKLYLWLNDMHLGISPDEFTPDDERKCRTAQTDIIEDVMGWIEANVFEPKTGSEGNI